MKKYLAVLLAIVLTLSFFTFTVSAADAGATPYALRCPECGNVMRGVQRFSEGESFRVLTCFDYNFAHQHYEVYVQTNWVCQTSGCPEKGYEMIGADPVFSHNACSLKN